MEFNFGKISFLFVVIAFLVVLKKSNSDSLVEGIEVLRSDAILPNPWDYPTSCGREGLPRSAICDPHHLIWDKVNEIEGYLNTMSSAEGSVAVVNMIDESFIGPKETVSDATARIAKELHNSWEVGG
jgi:hypothetical protein